MKFKAVYDEATVPTKLRLKNEHALVVILIATMGDKYGWVVSDDDDTEGPWTTNLDDYEPVPELTPSDALPGDLWQYGDYSFTTKYRVLGVDPKAGVWHLVAHESFAYKSSGAFAIQFENRDVTVYTRSLPDEISSGRTMWKLVERPS